MVAPQPACYRLLSSLSTLAEERCLQWKDWEADGETGGEIDKEIAVERDGNRRTGASHTIAIY